MILGLHLEVVLVLVYASFLVMLALVLELLARRSQQRVEDYRSSGFIYFRELDYFECPAGHQLIQLQTDPHRRTTSYRAPASACNFCSLKLNCTDSDEGRVLEKRWGGWIESEIRRFHRGMSLTLLLLATMLLIGEIFRYSQPGDRQALAMFVITLGFVLFKLSPSLRQRRSE